MLSILVPTYNFDVFPLVSELHRQCETSGKVFEILVLDDGSQNPVGENLRINSLPHCTFEQLEANIGRSRIRNLLEKKARFNMLLFLDADVMPVDDRFISRYIAELGTAQLVAGGLRYSSEKPEKEKLLRWTYGSRREAVPTGERKKKPYQSVLASNFMIARSAFEKVRFNESIPDLRREDTLFSYDLMRAEIDVKHIDNPVYHLGIDTFETAIDKEHQSLEGLKFMLDRELIPYDYIKLSRLYKMISDAGLRPFVSRLFKATKRQMLQNLSGNDPSLNIFDLYRIGYLCTLKSNKKS